MKLKNKLLKTKTRYKILEKIKKNLEPIFVNVKKHILVENYINEKDLPIIKTNILIDSKSCKNFDNDTRFNKRIKLDNIIKNNNLNSLYQKILAPFIDLKIMKSIIEKYNKYDMIIYRYKTNTIKVHSLYNRKINYKDITIKIIKMFSLMEFQKFKNEVIDFYYIPTNFKKKIIHKNFIGASSVNSAFCNFYPERYICVFRKECSDKVVLHELIHHLKIEPSSLVDNIDLVNNLIISDMNINNDSENVSLFESYTDSLAIIFNSVLDSIMFGKNINHYFFTELRFLNDTVINLIKHFGFKNINELFNKKSKKKFIQKSNVISYYVLKLGLLMDIDNFIDLFGIVCFNQKCKIKNANWNTEIYKNLYFFSKKNLLKKKIKHYGLNNTKSLKMCYNSIIY